MAPITRSSVHGRPAALDLNRPAAPEQPNDNGDESDAMEDLLSVDDENQNLTDTIEDSSPLRSAQDMLLPLQETADRVSRQVEEFAKSLDKFKSERNAADQELWDEALSLLRNYIKITNDRFEKTQARSHASQRETDAQLDVLKLESDLWILTENLLLCKCPDTAQTANLTLGNQFEGLHRYSTNRELWETFLNGDVVAQEYEVILDWLQQAAADFRPPLEDIVHDLAVKSERGDGIWSAGPIFTKDAIKKQKRARVWPSPLDSSIAGIDTTHIREDGSPLVMQIDPDAPVRERAKLAEQDEYHEQAAWRVCWEMLRQGMKPQEIRSWWSDRKESWRTALLVPTTNEDDQASDSPWLRIMNMASGSEYKKRCEAIAVIPPGNQYEEAVHGLLSGHHAASMMACDTLDDVLHSYFNSVLTRRWTAFVAACTASQQDSNNAPFKPAESSFAALNEFLADAAIHDTVKDEFHNPHKFIEVAVVGQDYEYFFVQQGHSTAQIAHLANQSPHLMEKDTSSVYSDGARIAAQNPDAVRIIAHLQLLLRRLGFLDKAYHDHPYQMDNNIVNYIGFLERDSKYYLLPLYASQLAADRVPHVMGTILIRMTDPREREAQVKLMKSYSIDAPVVLFGIFQLANYQTLELIGTIDSAEEATKITEYVESTSVKTVKIRTSFMSSELSSAEEDAVLSVEWMRYMDAKSWGMAVYAVSTLYKMFLLSGQLSAAKHLVQRANLAEMSLAATGMNLSVAATFGDEPEDEDFAMTVSAENIEDNVQPVSPSKRRFKQEKSTHLLAKETTNREELAAQSRVWSQLEQLVDALWALERWQDFAHEIESIRGNLAQMRTAKRELQAALHEVQSAMNPILDIDFLGLPTDDDERQILTLIRNHYIPEVILGYNSALYFAGHSLTRQYLVECMNLAQEVAQNGMLTSAFVAGGRMRELVTAFALDSQALLRANEAGGGVAKVKKGGVAGKADGVGVSGRADIWQVTWNKEKETNFDEID